MIPLDKCGAVVGVLTIICINNVWYLIPDLGLLLLPPTLVGNLMIAASISRGYINQDCFCQIKKAHKIRDIQTQSKTRHAVVGEKPMNLLFDIYYACNGLFLGVTKDSGLGPGLVNIIVFNSTFYNLIKFTKVLTGPLLENTMKFLDVCR